MQAMEDMELPRDYAAHDSEAAFALLVSRRISFVYSAALRQARDPHLAEEVAQAVFIILARKAGKIGDKTILSGWLFKTTRFAALAQTRAAAAMSWKLKCALKSKQPPRIPSGTTSHPCSTKTAAAVKGSVVAASILSLVKGTLKIMAWRKTKKEGNYALGSVCDAPTEPLFTQSSRRLGCTPTAGDFIRHKN